ncbi:hypothetical protein Tco_0572649 [Tanacetum coccineum]
MYEVCAFYEMTTFKQDDGYLLLFGKPALRLTLSPKILTYGKSYTKGNSQVKDCKVDLLIQQYEKFSISSEETINSGFTRFNVIVTSLKSLDQDYSSKNHVRKFLRALLLKWRSTMMDIEEAKTTKEKVKSLASKAKVTREQTSDDSNSQGGSDEEVDEEETEAFNLMARNFRKFFRKDNRFGRKNRFGYRANMFGRGYGNNFRNKGGESSRQRGAWSDSKDGDEPQDDATCLMAFDSQEVQPKPSTYNNNIDLFD